MSRSLFTLLGICLWFAGRGQQLSLTVIKENFDDNRFGWYSAKSDSSDAEITNGKYLVTNRASTVMLHKKLFALNKNVPMTISAAITLHEGVENRGYGIEMNVASGTIGSSVRFLIAGNGLYIVEVYPGNKKPAIKVSNGWKTSTALLKGRGVANVLRIDRQGNQYAFLINGTPVEKTTLYGQPEGNQISFYTGSKLKVLYDDVEITQWAYDNTLPGKITGKNTAFNGPVRTKPQPSTRAEPQIFYYYDPNKKSTNTYDDEDEDDDWSDIFGNARGLTDKDGYRILDPMYTVIGGFSQKRASLALDSSYAVIDDKLNMLTPFVFRKSVYYSNNYAIADLEGRYGLINLEGKTVLPFVYRYLTTPENGVLYAERDGKTGIISIDGTELVPFGQLNARVVNYAHFKNGMIKAFDAKQDILGLLGKDGNWVVQPQYKTIVENADGTYTFSMKHPSRSLMSVYGVMDKTGKVIIQPVYGSVRILKNNLVLGNEDCSSDVGFKNPKARYALADKTGKLLTPMKYLAIRSMSDSADYFAAVTEIPTDPSNRFGKTGLLDKKGKEVVPCTYENHESADNTFGNVSYYSEGLLNVAKDRKYGYIDHTNKMVIPFVFSHASYFLSGKAPVTKDGESYSIDKTGKKIAASTAANDDFLKLLPPLRP